MPELGSIGHREAASLPGVARFNKDSGKCVGARHIRGGRRRPRNGLYMAATSAARDNPDMEAVFDRLKAAGKEHEVIIVAIIRKLITLSIALLRDGRQWMPQPAKSRQA